MTKRKYITIESIVDIIEFLDNLGGGQSDDLGKECEQHSKTLKKLITLIF